MDGMTELARRRRVANSFLAFGLLVCGMLYLWPPTQAGFYPACPIHTFFGIQCPGCGATRALSALLHGHLTEAWRLNALFVLLLPFGLGMAAEKYRRAVSAREFRPIQVPAPAMYATLAAAVTFMIFRNVVR